jgi:hypothetical protein
MSKEWEEFFTLLRKRFGIFMEKSSTILALEKASCYELSPIIANLHHFASPGINIASFMYGRL